MGNSSPRRILRPSTVLELTGLSKSTVRRLEQAGNFPQRFRLSVNAVGYDADAVETWVAERASEKIEIPASQPAVRSSGRFQKRSASGDGGDK